MFRPFSRAIFVMAFGVVLAIRVCSAQDQKSDSDQNKHLDIQSSAGDLHLGNDADARKAGLPLYPGARPRRDKDDSDPVNLGLLTEAFGFKIVVAKYESDDAPGKVIDFYRDKLKKYGKVLECHTREHGGDAHTDIDDDKDSDSRKKDLKCDGDNTGPVTELKVGREDNQHVVAIEPRDGHAGSTFALVYVYTRGKQGDI